MRNLTNAEKVEKVVSLIGERVVMTSNMHEGKVTGMLKQGEVTDCKGAKFNYGTDVVMMYDEEASTGGTHCTLVEYDYDASFSLKYNVISLEKEVTKLDLAEEMVRQLVGHKVEMKFIQDDNPVVGTLAKDIYNDITINFDEACEEHTLFCTLIHSDGSISNSLENRIEYIKLLELNMDNLSVDLFKYLNGKEVTFKDASDINTVDAKILDAESLEGMEDCEGDEIRNIEKGQIRFMFNKPCEYGYTMAIVAYSEEGLSCYVTEELDFIKVNDVKLVLIEEKPQLAPINKDEEIVQEEEKRMEINAEMINKLEGRVEYKFDWNEEVQTGTIIHAKDHPNGYTHPTLGDAIVLYDAETMLVYDKEQDCDGCICCTLTYGDGSIGMCARNNLELIREIGTDTQKLIAQLDKVIRMLEDVKAEESKAREMAVDGFTLSVREHLAIDEREAKIEEICERIKN